MAPNAARDALEVVEQNRLVARHACVQHGVVVPAGDRGRVELDRSEPTHDLQHYPFAVCAASAILLMLARRMSQRVAICAIWALA